MTIIEAIRSGRPFRRKHWQGWWQPSNPFGSVGRHDVLADDWEVQPKEHAHCFCDFGRCCSCKADKPQPRKPREWVIHVDKARCVAECSWEPSVGEISGVEHGILVREVIE